ncbi:MAG: methylmalonyl Co-A mutase-associated GTPase MeaB [Chitinophagaceae bacterium]
MWQQLLQQISTGDTKALARAISLVENEYAGYTAFLQSLPATIEAKTIGITGPPGAGKSTLVDSLLALLVNEQKKVAVLCVDPSSPFKKGALLGDRIRMSRWYNTPTVYIRSLATRGSLGGLHPKIIEISDIVKAAGFDYVIIETVGVGQSEIEIAGLADTTVVVLVPEAGDEIQAMKSGLMEIADLFVINKSDRPGADLFARNLRTMMATGDVAATTSVAIVKTNAAAQEGIAELWQEIDKDLHRAARHNNRSQLLAEKAFYIIQQYRMKDVDKNQLRLQIDASIKNKAFNFYQLLASFTQH